MSKTSIALISLILAGAPAFATASCMGHDTEQAMSCATGTVWDADSQRCVPTTG